MNFIISLLKMLVFYIPFVIICKRIGLMPEITEASSWMTVFLSCYVSMACAFLAGHFVSVIDNWERLVKVMRDFKIVERFMAVGVVLLATIFWPVTLAYILILKFKS